MKWINYRAKYKINDQVYTIDFAAGGDPEQMDLGMSARSHIRKIKKHPGVAGWEIKIISIDPI